MNSIFVRSIKDAGRIEERARLMDRLLDIQCDFESFFCVTSFSADVSRVGDARRMLEANADLHDARFDGGFGRSLIHGQPLVA